ncbi:MAG TPA: alpha/beta hydrolase fold domain-containing protein [Gemmatimonadales bacterium]|nr:alpha/beta hydrolase fold domain-containing protein [Gemmatimonadales bacterium]
MWLFLSMLLAGDIHQFPGAKPVPHERFIHVVSDADSPVERSFIKSKDGVYVAAAVRKPKGSGPFPVLVHFHGAPGGRGMEQLVGWARGDHGSPVFERFLQEGYVIVIADYRAASFATLADAPPADAVTYADDAVAVIDHVRKLPYVDPQRIQVYGVSLGGDVTMHLLARTSVRAAILGAGAPIRFLGIRQNPNAPPENRMTVDEARAAANIEKVTTPILILVGGDDSLLPVNRALHDRLEKAGKRVRMEIYEGGYHDFVMGPQGQNRPDLKSGEQLLDITLQALESALTFVKNPAP